MQTHSNITEYNESTVYRNIIAICCPLHLVQNWENAVDQIISCLGVFLKEKYNKYLKRYTFANINNIQDLGKDDEIAFVIYRSPQTGLSVSLTLKPDSCENAPLVYGKIILAIQFLSTTNLMNTEVNLIEDCLMLNFFLMQHIILQSQQHRMLTIRVNFQSTNIS